MKILLREVCDLPPAAILKEIMETCFFRDMREFQLYLRYLQ